jgi:hypothetical protein
MKSLHSAHGVSLVANRPGCGTGVTIQVQGCSFTLLASSMCPLAAEEIAMMACAAVPSTQDPPLEEVGGNGREKK